MSWPAVLLWLMIVAAAFSNGPALIYILSVSGVFCSLQMLPGDSGGINMLPQSVCAAVMVGKFMIQRGNVYRSVEASIDPMRVGLFTAYVIFSLIGAYALPRAFSGLIEVVPVSAFRFGTALLGPNPGNITQSCYLLLSFATTLVFSVIGSNPEVQRHYLLSLLLCAIGLIVTGLADLICYHAGLTSLLDPFRTATYSMLTDVEAIGAKRVVGLTPEASAYGALCVGALASLTFLRPLFRAGNEQLVVLATIAMLLVMIALSTSSGSYVGAAVFAALYLFDLACRLAKGQGSRIGLQREVGLLIGLAMLAFGTVVLKPSLIDPVVDMVDKMVFQKTSSASYVERSFWNQVGWQAFIDSGGLGVGLGSIRVSNWTISILGSTGIVGGLLMLGFIAQKLLISAPYGSPREAIFANGLKLGLIPILAMYQLGGTIPDIGIPSASILGFLAVAVSRPIRSSGSSWTGIQRRAGAASDAIAPG